MGGGSSHTSHYEPPVPDEPTVPTNVKVSGLKNGDNVIVNGEAYAGSHKFFVIDFCNGDDIVFHFKVILLDNEGSFNKIKMNTMTAGTWGEEEYVENLIYLNHHFQLIFVCLEDKFSIELNGKQLCEYKHRVSPGKIDGIYFNGDANWKDISTSENGGEKVKPDEISENEINASTPFDVKLFVQGLTAPKAIPCSGSDFTDGAERLSEIMTEGLGITKKLLGENKSSFLKDIVKYSGYLQSAFSAGGAVVGFIQFISTYGEPSDMQQVIDKLNEITVQLKKIQETVEKGFADVVEHMDLVQFREEVTIPVRTMFDLYLRCYTVRGSAPKEDFKKQCMDRKSPRAVFSAMYDFLDSRKNLFETHLKAQKYAYSVYDDWSNALFDYSAKLNIMNMFYYGILGEERKAAGNLEPLINEQDEITDLINQSIRMDARLKEIEENRMKTFHSGGYGAEFLAEHYKNHVKHSRSNDFYEKLPFDTLPKIAYQMKNSWKGFNGPADNTKVSVAENVGQLSDTPEDTISIILIQPVTKEMREANSKVNSDDQETLMELIKHAEGDGDMLPENTLGKIKEHLSLIPFKPLVVLYNTDYCYDERTFYVAYRPFLYEMSSEAWSNPGGPCPSKFFWANMTNVRSSALPPLRVKRVVQILFQ